MIVRQDDSCAGHKAGPADQSGSILLKSRTGDVALLASDITRLDTSLRRYGPEAGPVRDALHRFATMKVEDFFLSDSRPNVDNPATLAMLDNVEDFILTFKSGDDRQRWLSTQALQLALAIGNVQAPLSQEDANSLPLAF